MKILKLPKFNGQALKLTALVLALWSAFTIANYFVVEFTGTGIEIIGNHNRVHVQAAVTVQCLDDWVETPGQDPDTKESMKVCTSPDRRFTITARENQAPVGYDGLEKRFLTEEETAGLLK